MYLVIALVEVKLVPDLLTLVQGSCALESAEDMMPMLEILVGPVSVVGTGDLSVSFRGGQVMSGSQTTKLSETLRT